ncbi:DUF1894 domain-containing protein [Methanothermococcus okinawensis]|uniref:Uncharacterized conserved protein UCP006577 n=1 Tax=Methanothermococcus okinawensis (strain DSM 14208 / JCM 11175 / IH1) TaxID=647113 RepID=F8AMW9_METOI|nr:DUF1894 domain-containing protein [Methanothermococcus okinawensis]AEH06092.1 Uncharacterized conserved protein UCP006577 [Methanothermococcus okinawensis IH1]
MACIDNYNYEILLKGSFRECAEYIKNNYKNIRDLNAGEEVIEGVMLIGKPPIPIAYEGDYIIFPYTKPCYGSFVLKVPLKEYLKSEKKKYKDMNKDKKDDKSILSKLKFW